MQDQIDRICQRLQYLEDLEAIRTTWRDYCKCLDSEDWNGLADVYCSDGTLEMRGLDSLLPGSDGVFHG
ncbi:MAG: nuclear transport factor 2 family protein, partial [Gammaproteobacteria bacterium]